MLLKRIVVVFLLLLILLLAIWFLQDLKKGPEQKGNYELVGNWPQLPAGMQLGNPTGIAIDTMQQIIVFHRAGRKWPLFGKMPDTFIPDNTVLVLDRQTGRIRNSWGANRFIMPHGLIVDRNNNIWLTDVALHQVFRFSHNGQLQLVIGEARVPGKDRTHFNQPTGVAVAEDGSFYVSDGYGNSRVVKFSAEGAYQFEWGTKGSGDGQFNIPHGLTLDAKGNVYVADRENSRIQVFTPEGKWIRTISNKTMGNVCTVTISKHTGNLLAADDLSFFKIKHRGSDVLLMDSLGIIQTRFGRSGSYKGTVCWYHDLTTDKDGNIYAGDIEGNRVQKFRKIN